MEFKFEKLEVWQLAIEYLDLIYELAAQLPPSEEYNLKSQIIRAGTSLGVCRPTPDVGATEKSSFTRCARINDHGAVKGSNTPGKYFKPGIPTDS
jgi:hypothetical protein